MYFDATYHGVTDICQLISKPVHTTAAEQASPYCLSFAYVTFSAFNTPPLSIYTQFGDLDDHVVWKVPQAESLLWRETLVQMDLYDQDQVGIFIGIKLVSSAPGC